MPFHSAFHVLFLTLVSVWNVAQFFYSAELDESEDNVSVLKSIVWTMFPHWTGRPICALSESLDLLVQMLSCYRTGTLSENVEPLARFHQLEDRKHGMLDNLPVA
jgi:hypothetical protein